MYVSFLRERGSWSLFHRIVSKDEYGVLCACGWEYDAHLERRELEKGQGFAVCRFCSNGISAPENEIRVGVGFPLDAGA